MERLLWLAKGNEPFSEETKETKTFSGERRKRKGIRWTEDLAVKLRLK